MIIREITGDDTARFYQMTCRLDEETQYMMFEPGERQAKACDLNRLRERIEAASGEDFVRAAIDDDGEIVGYIWAERRKLNRVRHTAYIVVGIRRAWRRQGIGTAFFRLLDDWARANGVVRLELTVECANDAAKRLYEKHGFRVEGVRSKSMRVEGRLVDEYYMAKIME